MELLEKFKANLISNKLVELGDQILLAVSGGLDSIALLDLFFKIRDSMDLKLGIVHVHHGIRGDEADGDLEFVRSLSEKYNLPFYFKKVDAKKFAREKRFSLEESARILRYQIYQDILQDTHFNLLATGHTADDQAETILYHFLRGAGILGLTGIPKVRGPYIRPLLIFNRKDLETYVQQNGLNYRIDSTNDELKYKRNRIRKELIPYLKKYFNPNLVNTMNRTGEIFRENEQFLRFYAKKAFKSIITQRKKDKIILDIEKFLTYFIVLRKYIIFHAFDELSIDRNFLNFDKLERVLKLIVLKKVGKRFVIHLGWELIIDYDGIVIKKKKVLTPPKELNVSENGPLQFQNYEFNWSILENRELVTFDSNPNIEFLDLEQTGRKLYLRNFLPGDRFIPLNFKGHKKVSEYFSDRKIPHHVREEVPILETSRGIAWLCGYCLDDRFKITEHSKRILMLEMHEVHDAS